MSRVIQVIAAAGMLALAGCSSSGVGSRGSSYGTGGGSYGGSGTSGSPILNDANDNFGSTPSYGRNRSAGGAVGRIDPTAGGAVIGALVGTEAGRSLDKEDRQRAYVAAQTSFRSGSTTRWSNEATGHYGTVDPTPTYTSRTGQTCRNFSHTMWVDGRNENIKGESCRQTDGNWQISS